MTYTAMHGNTKLKLKVTLQGGGSTVLSGSASFGSHKVLYTPFCNRKKRNEGKRRGNITNLSKRMIDVTPPTPTPTPVPLSVGNLQILGRNCIIFWRVILL